MSYARKIYSALGVFVGPTPATGFHLSSGLYSGASLINQLSRVQTVNDSWAINRVDVNQFAQLGAIDRIIVEPPMSDIEITWDQADLSNERMLGFYTSGDTTFVRDLLNKTQDEKNYFIAAAPEGIDLYNYSGQSQTIQVTNAYISSYRAEGAVGRLPTASIKAEGLNWAASTGSQFQLLKAVDRTSGVVVTNNMLFSLPVGTTGMADSTTALRPGDITVNIGSGALGLSISDLKIQSYNLSINLNRESLMKLGSFYAYSKEIRWPVNANVSITARLGDTVSGDISQLLCNDVPYNMGITMKLPSCTGGGATAIYYGLSGFKLDGEQNSNSIGSDSMLTLNYTAQLAGQSDITHGIFMTGISW